MNGQPPLPPQAKAKKTSGIATAGFVLALLSVCFAPLFLVALPLSIVGLVKTGNDPSLGGRGLAIAGTIISALIIPIIGIQAAIAIPNFIRFQARSKQAECKINLKSLYAAQKSFAAEKGRFTSNVDELFFSPERGNRYAYVLDPHGPLEVRKGPAAERVAGATRIGADELKYPTVSTDELLAHLPPLAGGEAPGAKVDGFTAACIGNVDSDETFDVWSISSHERTSAEGETIPAGLPFNDVNDVSQ